MAHLPDDALPSQFDVVVDGTGLVQSLLAAALARVGKSVLHIDGNAYYGEQWATLMHRELEQWVAEHTGQSHDQSRDQPRDQSHDQSHDPAPQAASDATPPESVIQLKRPPPLTRVTNMVEIIHDAPEEPPPVPPPSSGQEPSQETESESGSTLQQTAYQGPGNEPQADSQTGGEEEEEEEPRTQSSEGAAAPTGQPKLTWQSLAQQRRRFNFDIVPKLLYCRGAMVNVLTGSGCGRYVEFKAVNKIFTHANGKTEQVPCSRSDVFSSKSVSMLEKRKMMKFLTFCAEFEKHPEEYEEFTSLPYVEFLRLKDLTPNLIQYILHCIAMVDEQTPTLEGLKTTQIFLNSLGRFGNAPFLYPVFGVSELPQAFCRFCAVFGGVYCLRRHIQALLVSREENKVTGIVCSNEQRITCSCVVTSAALLKDTLDFRESLRTTRLSRGIFVTDGPLQNTEGILALLTIPPFSLGSNQTMAVRLLQLDPGSNTTAEGTYMIHMVCLSVNTTAQQDLECVARSIFKIEDQAESNSAGPRLLWSLYFNLPLCSVNQAQATSLDIPVNVYVTSDPDGTIAYENAVKEARGIYQRICPGEEFLPHPPDPEDIIYEGNPGDEGDNEAQGWAGTTESEESPPQQPTNETADQDSGESPTTDAQ